MSKKPEKRSLGRGLSALMADIEVTPATSSSENKTQSGVSNIPIEKISANVHQPRQDFHDDDLAEKMIGKIVGKRHFMFWYAGG